MPRSASSGARTNGSRPSCRSSGGTANAADGAPAGATPQQLLTVRVDKPEATNSVLGQTHFIKSVDDIHEALVTAVPGIESGLAFCEASGKCLVRGSGTDEAMMALARQNALNIAAGHSFNPVLGDGFSPVNVLSTLKSVSEVRRIFGATANPAAVVRAETGQGRGFVDRSSPRGVEDIA